MHRTSTNTGTGNTTGIGYCYKAEFPEAVNGQTVNMYPYLIRTTKNGNNPDGSPKIFTQKDDSNGMIDDFNLISECVDGIAYIKASLFQLPNPQTNVHWHVLWQTTFGEKRNNKKEGIYVTSPAQPSDLTYLTDPINLHCSDFIPEDLNVVRVYYYK